MIYYVELLGIIHGLIKIIDKYINLNNIVSFNISINKSILYK